jgi:type II secretory pathway pseudopilin PulG
MNCKQKTKTRSNSGFTLLEALFASMLIGLVIAALVASSGAYTMANAAGVDMSTAEFLIEQIRERTAPITFSNLPGFAGNFTPPIDVNGNPMAEFAAFQQQVAVQNVSSADFSTPAAGSDFIRIAVTITKNGQPISNASWIRAKLD